MVGMEVLGFGWGVGCGSGGSWLGWSDSAGCHWHEVGDVLGCWVESWEAGCIREGVLVRGFGWGGLEVLG